MLKILHSFPKNDTKFRKFCQLTFQDEQYYNTYVDNLSQCPDIKTYDIIVLHYLRHEDCLFLIGNQIDIPMIWFFWGAEFFNNGKFYNSFLLSKTKLIRRKLFFHLGVVNGLKQLVKEFMPWLINLSKANRVILTALKKIDYIVPVVPGDYDLLRETYEFNAKHFHLNYINPLVESDLLKSVNGRNILLGNSSSFANNHFDAIDDLARIDLEDRKVIIPLSYGDKPLADFIADYAFSKLGEDRVMILREFMSFADYNVLLLLCDVVIMNHKRQQAVGNIVQSLLNGSHVYLRSESTVYQYLKDCGFHISAFNDVVGLSGLSMEDVNVNRELAKKIFGVECQHQKLKSLINQVVSE